MRRKIRIPGALCLLSMGFMALCRFVPGLAASWRAAFLNPVSGVLSALTARVPFPVAEVAALALALTLVLTLARRRLKGLLYTAIALLMGYALLWYPAYWADVPVEYAASVDQIDVLCGHLIDRLNGASLSFPGAPETLTLAEKAASGRVKAVRYPEWMDGLGISGLYVPWTGEALVRTDLSPAALPFTAVHEMMHARGIADEGLANIAAWQVCQSAGGPLAVSADLWALRYAMGALKGLNETLWQANAARMDPALQDVFAGMNGFAALSPAPPNRPLEATAGLARALSSYDALTGWLTANILPSL